MRARRSFPLLLALALGACPALAEDAAASLDPALAEDLRTALTLEGRACDEVVAFESEGETSGVATCANGRRYRLQPDEAGGLSVADVAFLPLRLVKQTLSHVPLMNLGVEAMTALVGVACDDVTSVRSDGALGQIFSCADGGLFHIVVRPSGRVEVVEEN